ncbi:MAG: cryptochrome/photolyase family protein [Rhodobacter sp.]|nr:cryptochrome/photolyase family protein [Rhodobacter sp.]
MVTRLVLVLGDQCAPDIAALQEADKASDIVVMAEVAEEASYVPHHVKKIAFVFSVMRHFAETLRAEGWQVTYTRLDDPENTGSIDGELLRYAARYGAREVLATEPGEFRLIERLHDMPLDVLIWEDRRFLARHDEFDTWAAGRKQLRMEYFYREMRRKTGILMDGGQPAGGKWNFDHDNRKPAPGAIAYSGPMRFDPDPITEEVLQLVETRFGNGFGRLRPFWFAVTPAQAQAHLARWIDKALPGFGDYQDAMLTGERFLYHAVIGQYLHAGLLDPLAVCQAAERAYRDGHAPINAVEGFIRQILGWREFIRGIYFHEGPGYTARNALGHTRKLPAFYWDAETDMACLRAAVAQTRDEAYAHHIQRLMVTGNFALLAGIDPAEVHEWYLGVYADACEWVEAPNTIGMSQFADGGIVGSKPYVSSGAYIDRMSDYCKSCAYRVKEKTGETACPYNLLYWHFLDRHRAMFEKNPRMANMYRTWDRMDDARRAAVLQDAERLLARLDAGGRI